MRADDGGVSVHGVEKLGHRPELDGLRGIAVIVVNLALYLPYFFQSTRFMLPAGCLVLVYAAAFWSADPQPEEADLYGGGDRVVDEEPDLVGRAAEGRQVPGQHHISPGHPVASDTEVPG